MGILRSCLGVILNIKMQLHSIGEKPHGGRQGWLFLGVAILFFPGYYILIYKYVNLLTAAAFFSVVDYQHEQ